MNICVFDQQDTLLISPLQIQAIVKHVLTLENATCHEVSIHFVDTPTICQLHEDYFDDPTTTDCISFPIDDASSAFRVLGEVFVCPETAQDYAKAHHSDPYRETTLYVVHGLLHLLGYDDIEPEDEQVMRTAEAKHMEALQKNSLVLTMSKKE
ncbi:MAG: rRNA maturation RNase YbeY [Chlamydiales bacterium]|nr:rRNA maturation RNase YbeY [Chlamydiales bacterium]